ncbi:CHAT domain-containing protein [Geminocystis sp.]|uniref:CHAT domain-containing protein n=1 Tax=Geminocystis sp. TaxID=2664100 RepID=UPI003593C20C
MFRKLSLFIAILSILGIVDTRFAHAQQIVTDGDTATIVTKNGDRITIDGNTLSRDGKNLFHSFREFGLSQQQIATFLTNPNIQNILTRVTGGNPSYINGLIQVVGGNSNLFLMNPAGIVFGQGASINVPADFTATTATGIGFNNGILNAIGSNDYQNLTGNPTNFVFNNNQNGSIINAGKLKVAQGSNINLVGGNVINTGTIETPQGKINIQAVEGTSRIKITPEGSLLSLEIDIPKDEQGNLLGFTPQDLPTLLTGANNAGINTPNITINNNLGVNGINPQIQVGNTKIPNETGIAIASGKISTSSDNLGGEITVLGNKVGVINGEIEANGATGGGKVLIGGDFQGKSTIPNSQITVVDKDSTIKANANISGEGGKVIIWADKNTTFTGEIETKGGINGGNGGFVEVSGKENLNFNGKVDTTATNGTMGTLLLDPTNIIISNDLSTPDGSIVNAIQLGSQLTNILLDADNNITFAANVNVINPNVDLTARANNSIQVNDNVGLTTNGGNVTLNSDRDALNGGSIIMNQGSFIRANGGNIILGGGINPLTTPAIGVANTGLEPNNRNSGISLRDATIETTGNGFISLRGKGFGGTGNSNAGISLQGNTTIRTVNSDITLVGTGQASGQLNHGISFGSPDVANDSIIIESSGSGNIELVGIHEGNGTNDNTGILTGGDDSANPTRITSNVGRITLSGLTNGFSIARGISIQENSQVNSIGSGTIYLDGESIRNNDGIGVFGAIITTGDTRLNTLILKDGSQQDIFIDSVSPSNFGDVTIGNPIISSARNVVLNDADDIRLGAIKVTGNLTVNANGNITDVRTTSRATITVGGTTSLNANGNNISLAGRDTFGGTNDFNILEIVNAQDVLISENNSLILGNSNITGKLEITSQGTITDNGVLTVGGLTTLNPNDNDIILDNTNNDFNTVRIQNTNNLTLADINDLILDNVDSLGNPANISISGDLDLRVANTTNINGNLQANSLTTDALGTTTLNGNVTTLGDQTYNDSLILTKDTEINGENIAFNNSIDSQTNPQNLTVTANTNINYGDGIGDDRIGANIGLNNLTSNAVDIFLNINRAELTLNNPSIRTIGNQKYTITSNIGRTLFLSKDTVINTNDFNLNGTIAIDPNAINGVDLTINAIGNIDISTNIVNSNIPVAIDTALGNRGGNIALNADENINIDGIINTGRLTDTSFVNNAGNVAIDSNNGFVNLGAISTAGVSQSGSVEINGNNILVGSIISNFSPLASGAGGDVSITGLNTLVLGEISAQSFTVSGSLLLSNFTTLGLSIPPNVPLLANSNITTTEDQIYNGSVLLNDNVIFTARNINFNGEIDSFDLNLSGINLPSLTPSEIANIILDSVSNRTSATPHEVIINGSNTIQLGNGIGDDRLGSVTGLASLTTTGQTNININSTGNSINTTGDQIFNNSVLLEKNTFLNGNNITFKGAVNGTNNLTINSNNNGITDFTDSVTGLNTLITNSDGKTIINGNITTTGIQRYLDNVEIANNVALNTTNNSITFNGTVNSQSGENNNLTLNTGNGDITFSQAVGDSQILGDIIANSTAVTRFNSTVNANNLTTNAVGTTRLNGNVTTTGNQVYNDDVILNTSTIFTTNNLTAKSIEVDTNSSNPISLTIKANDSVSISGKANENQPLAISTARNNQASGDIIITAENDINFGGVVNTTATSGTSFATNAGNISITSNNGNVTIPAVAAFGTLSSGEVNISGNNLILGPILTFLTSTNVTSGNINLQGNNINVNGTIQGQSLTTSGNFSLSNNSAFLNSGDASLSALGNANITTIGNQNYNNFSIQDNANLISTQGKINFSGSINTASNNLTVSSLNGVNFSDGGIISSASGNLLLQTTNPNGNIFIGSGNDTQFVITNLNQANGFNTITIGQNNSLGNITVNEPLTVNDPLILQASNINVNQTINGNDNASITIKGAKTTTTLNADIITQGNAIIIDDNVILGDNVTLRTNNETSVGGNIDILGSINGNQNLTLNAGNSDILINDSIGNNQALNILSITANNTNFGGGLVSTTGNQNLNSNLILSKNAVFDTQGSFSAKNISSTNTNVNINAQQITTENIVTKGGDISLISNNSSVNTKNLNTSATTGAAIAINSATTINTGNIETAGSTGNGGNVTLNAPNDIQVSTINTVSNNGKGGDVDVSTTGNFRATNTIDNSDISINSNGGSQGGAVTIDLFPGDSENNVLQDPRLPFIVGNGTRNGTAGVITNLNSTIGKGEYVVTTTEGNLAVQLLSRLPFSNPNNAVTPPNVVTRLDANVSSPVIPIATITQAQEILTTIEQEAAEKPAFIYVSFTPKGYQPRDLDEEFARREATNTQEYSQIDINKPNLQPSISFKPAQEDQLDLLIVTNKGKPIRVSVPVNRQQVVESATSLWSKISDNFALNDDYKTNAAELYSWLIAPIESQLKEQEISNLLFILPAEIRFIPIAALYDTNSQQFLVEKYSSGLAPSLNLNDNRYRPIKDLNLLAMGASQFADTGVTPLPAVGVELPTIKKVWNDEPTEDYQRYLNGNFTLEEIKANLERKPYGIVHFGTHGEFNPTETSDSFIQLYNSRLPLNEIRTLGLNQPLVELMVLSACETAFGNEIAELGFAGLAVQAGVKTAMGSVWQVSDTGTLALMTDFYSQLKQQTTKAEALRQTQLDMLTGKIYKTEDGSKIITPKSEVSLEGLPETSRQKEDFTHPFYWAPFTMIGNPW